MLDVKNIPSDFFVNTQYEVMEGKYLSGNDWFHPKLSRAEIVLKLSGGFIRYKYRLWNIKA